MVKRIGSRPLAFLVLAIVFFLVFASLRNGPTSRSSPERNDGVEHDANQELKDAIASQISEFIEEANRHETDNPQPESPPDTSHITKTVVMGRLMSEDTSWVAAEVPDWQNAVYVVDVPEGEESPTGLRTKVNKAKEATPYLTYIVDNYPNFTDVTAFIHAHRNRMPAAWHTDARNNDAKYMLEGLRLDNILAKGYANLRCVTEPPGCPAEVMPFRDPPDPERHAEHAYPYLYAEFFQMPVEEVRDHAPIVATPCCAQFAVSRAQLLERPREFYERMLGILETTHYDDDTSGRVMEYMWHIMFGRDAVHCPSMFTCYCEVYGRCGGRTKKSQKPGARHGQLP